MEASSRIAAKLAICFVAPDAYAFLSSRSDVKHIGGAEVQQVLIARGLLQRGYRVSFVTLDYGQPDGQDLEGITVYRAYRPEAGWPGLRFVHPRATRMWSAMKRADADVYYQRTSDSLTGIVAAFCRWNRRKFVFAVSSYADALPDLPHCPVLRERVLYRYGLRKADHVVAQTAAQKRCLRRHFGVDSVVIRSCAMPASAEWLGTTQGRPRMLWIGRFVSDKRLHWLLEVAGRCPEIDFEVLGDGPGTSVVQGLKERASKVPNVRMHGYVPHDQVGRYYDGASALICTSSGEGFPNTFLEAWCHRVPVITTFDPDGVVAAHSLGMIADSVGSLVEAVQAIRSDAGLRSRLSQCAHSYFREHHTVEAAVDAYDRLFRELC